MNENHLEPCPFCEEDEKLGVRCGGGVCPHCGEPIGHWYCYCESCGATTGTFKTLAEAVSAWNGASNSCRKSWNNLLQASSRMPD